MTSVRITWSNGDTTTTSINGTKPEILEYYIGKTFNIGDGAGADLLVKGIRVEFL